MVLNQGDIQGLLCLMLNIIILNVSNVICFTYDGKNSWLKSLIKFSGGFNSKHVSVEFRSLTQLDGLSLKFTMRDFGNTFGALYAKQK